MVVVPFPFSDLSATKRRPVVCLVDVGSRDWVTCQVTTNAYADPAAFPLAAADFASGGLRAASYVRPGKLFTIDAALMTSVAGYLTDAAVVRVLAAVAQLFQPSAATVRPAAPLGPGSP